MLKENSKVREVICTISHNVIYFKYIEHENFRYKNRKRKEKLNRTSVKLLIILLVSIKTEIYWTHFK